MNTSTIKLIRLILILTVLSNIPALIYAQRTDAAPLQSDIVILKYSRAPNATFVDLGRDMLGKYQADYCRTLQLKPSKRAVAQFADIESALNADRLRAEVIKEVIGNGKLISAYYRFGASKPEMQRYILYSYTANGDIYLISIGGNISTEILVNKLTNRLRIQIPTRDSRTDNE